MAERRPNRVRGPRHDEFWAYCAEGELRLQRCGACARLSWPAVDACEHCGSAGLGWERLSGKGKVVSWCTFERDYYRGMLPIPWPTILVELEEGALFISNPSGFDPATCAPGLLVEVCFLACEDDGGSFSLPVFEMTA